jgi:ectoine hydroxylase-related dioxygenase (phytanoyl-CoA dioxygenase family)
MSLTTLPNTATLAEVCDVIERDGGVIIEDFLEPGTIDGLNADLGPILANTPWGPEGFTGNKTRRVSALFKHSRHCAAIVTHPLYLGAAEQLLQIPGKVWYGDEQAFETPNVQIGATQAIEIHPGQTAQVLHRDDAIWQWSHPEGGKNARLQIMLALSEFTAENGATHVIPGSHKWDDDRQPKQEETIRAEMKKGSALLWLGSTYHAGGANESEAPRTGLSIGLDLGYLRQEENQYLAVPQEIVKEYPEKVRKLLGYTTCPPFMGWIEVDGILSDPAVVLEDVRAARQVEGFFTPAD